MANKIIPKRSSVSGKVPATTDLDVGEIAVNLTDRKIYTKDAGGTVVQLGGGAGSGDVVGPNSSTDNAIARFDLATGKLIQNSSATIDDSGNLTSLTNQATGTGANKMPVGTTAQRPPAPEAGMYRLNSTTKLPEWYNDAVLAWVPFNAVLPTLVSVSGDILKDYPSNLTLAGTNFGAGAGSVKFSAGATVETVSVTPTSSTSASVAVPSAIYSLSAGVTVGIQFINDEGGISNAVNKTIIALPTGGTITTSGAYRIHTFTSSGTFQTNGFAGNVEYLVIAGGGSSSTYAGGGGAGGYRTNVPGQTSGGNSSAESSFSVTANTAYTVTIGAGSASGSVKGSNSAFGPIVSTGGGTGNSDKNGGSGAGGGANTISPGAGSGTTGQGSNGGTGANSNNNTAGGGGAGGAGGANGGNAGNGGAGLSSNITGTAVTRGGGGGGGAEPGFGSPGSGGSGGGGNGTSLSNAGNGAANTGGGGGSCYRSGLAGNGGSGLVVVRYQL